MVYGLSAVVVVAVSGIAFGADLHDGVRVPRIERIDTPHDVLRSPTGWTRAGDATFRSGAVTGTIERLAVPRRLLETPDARRAFVDRRLREDMDAVGATGRGEWQPATSLAGLTGTISTFRYDDDGRTMVRIDHLLVNAYIERAWVFRAWFPEDAGGDAERTASNFPDDFRFPGIRVPVGDADS